VERQHLGGSIDGRHTIRVGRDAASPDPGPASKFQDIAERPLLGQRCLDPRDLGKPTGPMFRPTVVPTGSLEPLVVLAGPRPIVPELFIEQIPLAVLLQRCIPRQCIPKNCIPTGAYFAFCPAAGSSAGTRGAPGASGVAEAPGATGSPPAPAFRC
jgi:hypothetical protein